jgi:hypothetical protein
MLNTGIHIVPSVPRRTVSYEDLRRSAPVSIKWGPPWGPVLVRPNAPLDIITQAWLRDLCRLSHVDSFDRDYAEELASLRLMNGARVEPGPIRCYLLRRNGHSTRQVIIWAKE